MNMFRDKEAAARERVGIGSRAWAAVLLHPVCFTALVLSSAMLFVLALIAALRLLFAINVVEQVTIVADHTVNEIEFGVAHEPFLHFEGRLGYEGLDSRGRDAYRALYEAASLGKEQVTLDGMSAQEACDLALSVWYDSPELFYVDPFPVVKSTKTSTLCEHAVAKIDLAYLYGERDVGGKVNAYAQMLHDASASIPQQSKTADQVVAIHDWVLEHVTYDNGVAGDVSSSAGQECTFPESATTFGALINGKATCGGYAQAFCALCRKHGIECHTILGSVDGFKEAHAWNEVLINGEWLCVDVTWDDSVSNPHEFLLRTKEEFIASGHHAFERNLPPIED